MKSAPELRRGGLFVCFHAVTRMAETVNIALYFVHNEIHVKKMQLFDI